MWLTSVYTTLLGLTEPLFVPEYWNPPSLFDLAQKTGFDIESLIFCFSIGGAGSILYDILTGSRLRKMNKSARHYHRHRFHYLALGSPIVVFPALYFLPWNPIYPGMVAMFVGGIATMCCRPDLKLKTIVGGALFAAYYLLLMLGLKWTAPGYIETVWNLDNLSGVVLYGIPLEELLFGFTFGMYWAGVYEHLTWQHTVAAAAHDEYLH